MTGTEILERIEDLENTKIRHCAEMFNFQMQKNDKKSARIWQKWGIKYNRELADLYKKLDTLTS